jgi:hypothetical protein
MSNAHEVWQEGKWVAVSHEEWRTNPGKRRMELGVAGIVEYHGPVFEAGSTKFSNQARECRCSACTMFEGTVRPGFENMVRS